ncbi:MAG: hypothetical protein U0R24_11610 [Solirubrobacterales bacterium]
MDDLVAAGEDRSTSSSPGSATPGTRSTSARSAAGRSSAFEGMHA